jgi:hypothetical protein
MPHFEARIPEGIENAANRGIRRGAFMNQEDVEIRVEAELTPAIAPNREQGHFV